MFQHGVFFFQISLGFASEDKKTVAISVHLSLMQKQNKLECLPLTSFFQISLSFASEEKMAVAIFFSVTDGKTK